MLCHDVLTKQSQVVVDLAQHLGGNRVVWQMHSSHDDNVHSFTVKDGSGADLGCGVYAESTRQFRFFQRRGGEYDECQVDASGRYVLIKEDADGQGGLDNLVYDLTKGTSVILSDPQGALGHSDMGFGYGVGEDNYYNAPGAMRVWQYGSGITDGRLVFRATDWNFGSSHVSHTNARGDVPLNQQMACLSNANRRNLPRTNEISCFLLDGSLQVLVVAPVMTNLDASGGGDDYSKAPKGNLDPTGEFFLWTSNMGGNRLDVFMVHVPRPKLGSMPSTPSPSPSPSPSPTPSPSPSPTPAPAPTPSLTVAITSHQAGQQVGGVATITASASSPAGIVGVQFQIDGKDVAVEDTKAPYELSWNTRGVPNGTHTVSAVARDRNGVKRASAVSLNVSNANRRVRGDLNGDYQPDLLFSHTSGSLTSWILQGVARNRNQEVTPGYHDPQWRAVAVEDFNADDKVDIVWQHAQYGYVKIWLMDGTVRLREITPGPGSTSWRVAAAGDVDGDGHTDIIWQHASTHQLKIWLMRMTSLWIEVGTNPSQIYTGWKVVGAADLNRDGRSDLIIRHTGGSIAGWYMRGNRVIASRSLGSQWASPEWEVKAARDMNGDGYPDLVWQHRQSLQMYVWYLRDHQSYQDTYLNPTATGGGWTLAAQ